MPCGGFRSDAFVPPGFEEFACEDGPLPIGQQTISQPYKVAVMIEAAVFVPLIGEQGWAEDGSRSAPTMCPADLAGRVYRS